MRRFTLAAAIALFSLPALLASEPGRIVDANALRAQAAMVVAPLSCGSAPTLACSSPVTASPSCLSNTTYLDLYTFNGTAGQTITITTTTATGYQMLIVLFDSNAVQLADNFGPSPAALTYTFNASGSYIIGFAFVADFATGLYTLVVSCSGVGGTCHADSRTACLLNNRFKATVRFRGAFDNAPADTDASLKPVTGFADPSYETAFFYFNSSNNIEMLLKMLDQGNTDSSGHPTIAVLFGSATPLRTELTITDTKTGLVKKYTSQFGSQAGTTDFTAFVK
jgi:hypothetical protein